ncbi:hypothetical protein Agabi119p4_3931 [Agaricus bisporus var. burnettii]|uniref:Uncharacterized protein n=1 Tax=Agaricus bisporus var. burnettii TaxID=192524 RepID=A0A8H7F5S4_AGABI|nr:hypothetical protein Agabi119p4_3931 [Agaricus bisporus var. burnettii]
MDIPLLSYGSVLPQVFVILAVAYGTWKYIKAKTSPFNSIPAVGYSGMLTSYLTAFEFLQHGGNLVKEGFDKYPDQAFRVANLSQWLVVLSGTQFVDDVRKAPTDVLSASVALWEKMQFKYTLGLGLEHKYHVATIRTPLTRKCIPLTKDWTPVHAYGTLVHIICRVSNRFFVGLPLCRRSGYLDVIQNFIPEVAKAGIIINSFPSFLRPLSISGQLWKTDSRKTENLDSIGPTDRTIS